MHRWIVATRAPILGSRRRGVLTEGYDRRYIRVGITAAVAIVNRLEVNSAIGG
jgi:hypothetical protein